MVDPGLVVAGDTLAGLASVRSRSPLLYTPAQAAEMLAITESWLRRKAGLRLIPCTFVGKHLRFSGADLHAIVAAGNRPTGTHTRRARRKRRHPPKRSH
jgi:excisionase family DNA binding protein